MISSQEFQQMNPTERRDYIETASDRDLMPLVNAARVVFRVDIDVRHRDELADLFCMIAGNNDEISGVLS